MQLRYRGQTYSYPYTEQVPVSNIQALRIYRGVRTDIAPVTPEVTVPEVTSLRYRGIYYLRTLTPAFN
ncbi:DUF4278 domain-containing protein [Oscillatoria sp. FACHB-1407]|uniref:DUF4278 domain-containing protein n=1 Tax=Oscillatoria sp. FACHB-1407 TaxID=2692847 RepID=UPI001683715D|nr:DUF4278 domain-containing protein [Oscillatoria sp. FACHB-1407]MBD2461265.1 DUF4278 domain-containing protein [Oscillatoria sp. FACHB-1407]